MPFSNNDSTRKIIEKYLEKKGLGYTEDSFFSILEDEKSSKNLVYWSVLGLRDVGTSKSIPVLKKLLHYPFQDVKDCSILTISHIAGVRETGFYIEAFLDKKTRKTYPMWAIYDSADDRAIEYVLKYLYKTYNKCKNPKCSYLDYACIFALLYLDRYFEKDERIKEIFILYKNILSKFSEEDIKKVKENGDKLRIILLGE